MTHADKHPPQKPPKSLTDRVCEFAGLPADQGIETVPGMRAVIYGHGGCDHGICGILQQSTVDTHGVIKALAKDYGLFGYLIQRGAVTGGRANQLQERFFYLDLALSKAKWGELDAADRVKVERHLSQAPELLNTMIEGLSAGEIASNYNNAWIALFRKIKSDYERLVMPGLSKGKPPGTPD